MRNTPPIRHAIGIDVQADVRPDGPLTVGPAAPPPTRRRVRRALLAVLLSLGGLFSLGLALADNPPPPRLLADPADRATPPLDPAQALAPWADFPITAATRPLVVFEPVQYLPAMNAATRDSAFYRGLWELPEVLPSAPDREDGYPIRSARDAIAALRHDVRQESAGGLPPDATPVEITDVRLTRRTFQTDRGRVTLPAWTIMFGRTLIAPAVVLAADGPGIFVPTVPAEARGNATVSPDGKRLTYSFLGLAPGKGNCHADYTPVFQESRHAVAIGAMEHPGGRSNPAVCTLGSYERSVTVMLAEPLGNRVVVSYTYGDPLTVVPDGKYRWYRPGT
jgi:hypothetical protein